MKLKINPSTLNSISVINLAQKKYHIHNIMIINKLNRLKE